MNRREFIGGVTAGAVASAVGPPVAAAGGDGDDGNCATMENGNAVTGREYFEFSDGSSMGVASAVDHVKLSPRFKRRATPAIREGHNPWDYAATGIEYGAEEVVVFVSGRAPTPGSGGPFSETFEPAAGQLAAAGAEQLRDASPTFDHTASDTEFVAFNYDNPNLYEELDGFTVGMSPDAYYELQGMMGWKLAQFLRDYVCRSCGPDGSAPDVRLVGVGGTERAIVGALGALRDTYEMEVTSLDVFHPMLPDKVVAYDPDDQDFLARRAVNFLANRAIDRWVEGTEVGPVVIGDIDLNFGAPKEPFDTDSRANIVHQQVDNVRFWYHSGIDSSARTQYGIRFPDSLADGYSLSEPTPPAVDFVDVGPDYGARNARRCDTDTLTPRYHHPDLNRCVGLGHTFLATPSVADDLTREWRAHSRVTPTNEESFSGGFGTVDTEATHEYTVQYDDARRVEVELTAEDPTDDVEDDPEGVPSDPPDVPGGGQNFSLYVNVGGGTPTEDDHDRLAEVSGDRTRIVVGGDDVDPGDTVSALVVLEDTDARYATYELAFVETGPERRVVGTTCPTGSNPGEDLGANAAPTATLTGPSTKEPGDVVVLQAGGSDEDGSITEYRWEFGDGTTTTNGENGNTVSHSYDSPGEYTAEVTVCDNDGATATATHTVSVGEPPVARVDAPAAAAVGESVEFDGSGSSDPDGSVASYRWRASVGQPLGSGETLEMEFATPGEYTVLLTVVDEQGIEDRTGHTVEITESATASTSLSASPGRTEDDEPVELSVSTDVSVDRVEWVFGDGRTATTGSTTTTHEYDTVPGDGFSGTYTVDATVHADDGETATATTEVEVVEYVGDGEDLPDPDPNPDPCREDGDRVRCPGEDGGDGDHGGGSDDPDEEDRLREERSLGSRVLDGLLRR